MWYIHTMWGFPGNSEVKNMPAMQETQVKSLGKEDGLRWWLRPMEYFWAFKKKGILQYVTN